MFRDPTHDFNQHITAELEAADHAELIECFIELLKVLYVIQIHRPEDFAGAEWKSYLTRFLKGVLSDDEFKAFAIVAQSPEGAIAFLLDALGRLAS
jgi:hypothetical protein